MTPFTYSVEVFQCVKVCQEFNCAEVVVLIFFRLILVYFIRQTDRLRPILKISTCKAGLSTSEGKSIPPKVSYGSQEGGDGRVL